jgi:hypothetical protein
VAPAATLLGQLAFRSLASAGHKMTANTPTRSCEQKKKVNFSRHGR